MYSTSPLKMFAQNWAGPGGFQLESAGTDLPNKITTSAGKSLHTWLSFLPWSLEQHWQVRFPKESESQPSTPPVGSVPPQRPDWGLSLFRDSKGLCSFTLDNDSWNNQRISVRYQNGVIAT